MVNNLSQLKRTLQTGAQFRVIDHGRPECVGEEREVTYANTQGFYSIVPNNPNCRTSLANNGRGSHTGNLRTVYARSTSAIRNEPRNIWLCPWRSLKRRQHNGTDR